jgi:hypothetical protein
MRPVLVPNKGIVFPTEMDDDVLPFVFRWILVKLVLDLNHSEIERRHIGCIIAAGKEHRQIIGDVLGSEAFEFDTRVVQFRAKIMRVRRLDA